MTRQMESGGIVARPFAGGKTSLLNSRAALEEGTALNQLSLPIISLCLAILMLAWPVHATVILVDGTGDESAVDGVCTLREAIEAINSGTVVNECDGTGGVDTISIEAGGTITLQSALPALQSMTILGNGHAVSGDNAV